MLFSQVWEINYVEHKIRNSLKLNFRNFFSNVLGKEHWGWAKMIYASFTVAYPLWYIKMLNKFMWVTEYTKLLSVDLLQNWSCNLKAKLTVAKLIYLFRTGYGTNTNKHINRNNFRTLKYNLKMFIRINACGVKNNMFFLDTQN